ncbi:MAG: phosphoglucomutase [Ignavibacteriaceae bacterium]
MPDKIKFGTDGWRGIIDADITNKTIANAAQAFADFLIAHSKEKDILKVAIGHDGRTHSRPWALLFARVLSGNNIIAYLSDRIIPTPILSYYVKANNLSAGVMITASHNPAEYNGVKFKAHHGGPFSSEQTHEVESLLGKELVQADDDKIYQIDMHGVYFRHLERSIDFELIKTAGLNVLIDSMAGAGQQVLETMFMNYNIQSKTIYKIAEKDFAGRKPEPVEKNLTPLKEELLKGEYSAGLATDGDADRLGVLMENGEWLSAQETIILLGDYLVNNKNIKGDIVKTLSVTDKVRNLFEGNGRKVLDVEVGFKNISEVMIEEDIAFGCEESGGYGFNNHIPDKDGLYSALLLLEMLASSGYKKLSDFVREKRKQYGPVYYSRIDFASNNNITETISNMFRNPPQTIGNKSVVSFRELHSIRGNINGLKFSFSGSTRWLLIRASETEPVVRIYAEGTSNDEVNEFLEMGKNLFRN